MKENERAENPGNIFPRECKMIKLALVLISNTFKYFMWDPLSKEHIMIWYAQNSYQEGQRKKSFLMQWSVVGNVLV